MANMRPTNRNTLLKVVILGDGGVGKSCLMNRFVSNFYDDRSFHTIGVEFLNKELKVNNDTYTLQIWDTAGQEKFRALRTPFYRGTDICLICYAIDDKESFKNLRFWREEFLKYSDIRTTERFPFVVVGNKNDVAQSLRQVNTEEVSQWCEENHIYTFIETSAKTSDNVQESFSLAVAQWLKMEKITEQLTGHGTIDLTTQTINLNANTKNCCGGGLSNNNNTQQQIDDYDS